jgi:hypothetical protein
MSEFPLEVCRHCAAVGSDSFAANQAARFRCCCRTVLTRKTSDRISPFALSIAAALER